MQSKKFPFTPLLINQYSLLNKRLLLELHLCFIVPLFTPDSFKTIRLLGQKSLLSMNDSYHYLLPKMIFLFKLKKFSLE